jgi:hypothetical protein
MSATSTIATGQHDLSFAEYRSLSAWGSGSLKAMRRGPPSRVLWERGGHFETDATILGSAVHCALLTPALYAEEYAVKPDGMSFASKDGKAWRDDPCRAGRTLLSYDVGSTVEAIVGELLAKRPVAESLHRASARESSLVWDCSVTGERCKARPDWIAGTHIYDLKVSRHASGGLLAMRAYFEGWMHQLAHYRTGAIELGLPVRGGRLVVVEPTRPHYVYTLEVKADALDLLELENIETVRALGDCRMSGEWPGTPNEWMKIEPPASANLDSLDDMTDGGKWNDEAETAEEPING